MSARHARRAGFLAAALLALTVAPGWAQTSASYKLQETSINGGGVPGNAGAVASTSYRLGFAAVGDGAVRSGLASASFHMDGGFVGGYAPPHEVTGVRFTDAVTLRWDPDPSAIRYQVYRGGLGGSPGMFGACLDYNLTATTTTDLAIPPTGGGHFYLVTSRNRLLEEGTKGYQSNGTERVNPLPCP